MGKGQVIYHALLYKWEVSMGKGSGIMQYIELSPVAFSVKIVNSIQGQDPVVVTASEWEEV